MKLVTTCRSCRGEIQLKNTYTDRPDLIYNMGEYFELECQMCQSINEYHANDIIAQESISINLVGTIVGLLIMGLTTLFVWNEGFITNVGLIIGALIIGGSNYSSFTSNTNAFNKYKVTRTPKKD